MKKIVFLLMTIFCLISCEIEPGYVFTEARNGEENEEIKVEYTHPGYIYHVIEITYRGKTHEFITTDNNLVHWPDCKYCEKYKNFLDLEKIE